MPYKSPIVVYLWIVIWGVIWPPNAPDLRAVVKTRTIIEQPKSFSPPSELAELRAKDAEGRAVKTDKRATEAKKRTVETEKRTTEVIASMNK